MTGIIQGPKQQDGAFNTGSVPFPPGPAATWLRTLHAILTWEPQLQPCAMLNTADPDQKITPWSEG